MIKQGDTFTQRFSSDDEAAKAVIFEWLANNDVRAIRAVDFMEVPHYCQARIDGVRIIQPERQRFTGMDGATTIVNTSSPKYEVSFTVISAEPVR